MFLLVPAMWELDYLEQCGNSSKDFEMVSSTECFLELIKMIFFCVHTLLEITDIQLSKMPSEACFLPTSVQLNPIYLNPKIN